MNFEDLVAWTWGRVVRVLGSELPKVRYELVPELTKMRAAQATIYWTEDKHVGVVTFATNLIESELIGRPITDCMLMLEDLVLHELAHIICIVNKLRDKRGYHGKNWKRIARSLGALPYSAARTTDRIKHRRDWYAERGLKVPTAAAIMDAAGG